MSRSLELLHPKVKEAALQLKQLARDELGLYLIFTQTVRTAEEQKALYSQGRDLLDTVNLYRNEANLAPIKISENRIVTKAKTAQDSFHFYGLAFDIAITDLTGKKIKWDKSSDWNNDGIDDWSQVGRLAEKIPGLEWGGNWSSMPDPPHYQVRFGLTIADLKAGKTPPKN